MPYICLVRTDLPDGSVYIKDLRSESLRVPSIDPPGQARYVNRVQNDRLYIGTDLSLSQDTYGLSAYLADRLEPGGSETPTADITSNGPTTGDTITIGGVVFTAAQSTATGSVESDGPANGDTLTIKGVVFTAVENFAVGTVQSAGILHGDTFTLGGITFTAAANYATGTVGVNAAQNGDIVTIGTVPFTCVENFAFSEVTCATVQLGDSFTLGTVAFTAAGAGADPALQQFNETAGSDILVAGSLATAINDPASQALITAANPGLTVAAANGGTATVTCTCGQRGLQGETITTISSDPVRLAVSDPTLITDLPDPTAQEFAGVLQAVGGTTVAVATSIVTAVMDAASQALITAANPGVTITAANGGTDTVTLTADQRGLIGQIALATSTVPRLPISDANLVAAVPNPATQEFAALAQAVGGTDIAVATSLALTINDGASAALIAAVHPGITVAAANGGTDTVTCTCGQRGLQGQLTLVSSDAIRLPLSGVAMVAAIPVAAAQQFAGLLQAIGGTDTGVATSLAATINDAASQALIAAALPAGVVCTAVPALAVTTLTANAPGAQGEFALLESTADARIHLSGATMVSVEPHPANQEFATLIEAGTNALVAASIQATVNHANSQALFVAANDGVTVTCGAPVVDTVTLTASEDGQLGALTLATSAPARITLSDDHLTRTFEVWTPALLNALATPIIARMDAGLALTVTDIDALINAVPGVSNTSISSPASTTTVADILSILAGRGYYLPAGAQKLINFWTWDTTPTGGFGTPYLKQDTRMLGGEWRPNSIGGDLQYKEIKPIRITYNTDEFLESLDSGEIAVFLAKPGMPPVTLWPHSRETPSYPWVCQRGGMTWTPVVGAQVVVIYDDDGTVLV